MIKLNPEQAAKKMIAKRLQEIKANPEKWIAEFESGSQQHGRISFAAFNYVTFKHHEFMALMFNEAAHIVRWKYAQKVAQ
jgi:hypothetical protein